VLTENSRTLEAARILTLGDFKSLGRLMFQSHESLRRDFEVTIPQLDLLVESAAKLDYVAGSRMTGGGFGGCTISLVHRICIEDFRTVLSRQYGEVFGVQPLFMEAVPSMGAREF